MRLRPACLMKTSDFRYALPEPLIAQHPVEPRDASRMLVCNRDNGLRAHRSFHDFPGFLKPGDLLVLNESRVIPARLRGIKADTGIPAEVLLLKQRSTDAWEALVYPGRRLKKGAELLFGDGYLRAVIGEHTAQGGRIVHFTCRSSFSEALEKLGEMPLPPYIHSKPADPDRYQTVYAAHDGSVAAPTAGLHFTEQALDRVREAGADTVRLVLHVGLGTFRPVKSEHPEDHVMHSEFYSLSDEAAEKINATRRAGGRIVCVGTTSVRTLETLADREGIVRPGSGYTALYLLPGAVFRVTDLLLTNFHLPESTLLMLVSAFMGTQNALEAYREAVSLQYRFFSFGDCMLIGRDLVRDEPAPCGPPAAACTPTECCVEHS